MLIGIYSETTGQADTSSHTVELVPAGTGDTITATQVLNGATPTNVWKAEGLVAGLVYAVQVDSAVKHIVLGDASTLQVHIDGHGSGTGGAIATADIEADAIDGTLIADDAVDSEHIVDGAVDLAHLAADSVDGTKIADDAVDSEHIVDGAVDLAHLAADSVDGTKIVDDSVDSEHIAGAAIDLEHLSSQVTDRQFSSAAVKTGIEGAFDVSYNLEDGKGVGLESTMRIPIIFNHLVVYTRGYDNVCSYITMGDEVATVRGEFFCIPVPARASGSYYIEIVYLSPGDGNNVYFECSYKFLQDGDSTVQEALDGVLQAVPSDATVKVAMITLSNQEASGDKFLAGLIRRGSAADGDTTVGDIKVIGCYLRFNGYVEED